ncbi:MAG: hypothetical protein D6818_03465, partial [Bacteroidetes bacterium]
MKANASFRVEGGRWWLAIGALFLFCLSANGTLRAQSDARWGGVVAGVPFVYEHLPEGRDYQPYQLLGWTTLANLKKRGEDRLYWYAEPQLVYVTYSDGSGPDWEVGLNSGLMYQLALGKGWFATAAIGTGPHFVTVETPLQARGFIFSDNFEAGLIAPLGPGLQLHLRSRFRHISNAGLKNPN